MFKTYYKGTIHQLKIMNGVIENSKILKGNVLVCRGFIPTYSYVQTNRYVNLEDDAYDAIDAYEDIYDEEYLEEETLKPISKEHAAHMLLAEVWGEGVESLSKKEVNQILKKRLK